MEKPLIHQPISLVLASASPIRAQLLKGVGLAFSVAPSNVDETAIKQALVAAPHPSPLPQGEGVRVAQALARAKALNVSEAYPNHLTLGADQVCALDNTILSKPVTRDKAMAQLQQLRSRTHHQHSAICLVKGSEVVWEHVSSAALTLRALTDAEIAAYVQHDEPLQACGSYRVEGMGKHLFERIEGDDDTIAGLPLVPLLFTLYRLGGLTMG